ncbi:MAG TPA: PilW family protein [Casimicrobiaceae bacterium]|nr:PilW family protein [Casimicrobiaceae bacterium]
MDEIRSRRPRRRADAGFGLIEIMVGLVIGLIAVLVIYQVYNVAEGFKRNTTAAGEAQMAGLFSAFVLGMEISNGGAAMAISAADLASCSDTGNIATTFRPIPVLITDGGGASKPDSFVVTYSMATTLVTPAMFNFDANADDPYDVQSAGGFHVGDLIVAIAKPGSVGSDCPSSVVTAATVPDLRVPSPLINDTPTNVANVTLTHTATGSAAALKGDGRPGLSTLFNMGPCSKLQKVRYDVDANGVLRSTPLLDTSGGNCGKLADPPVPNPLASNIVNMKVEYGIDSDLDPQGLLDTWVQAGAGGGWDPATLLPAALSQINQIKAIRIGIIVQSEQFDKTLAGFTGGDYVNGAYNWVLFDCANANKALCPGRLTGSVAASVSPPGNWRFRKYETIIPLRNEIWNKAQ